MNGSPSRPKQSPPTESAAFSPSGTSSRFRTSRRARAGFSLIEILLVLVILATLAAIVVPKFVGRSEQARITATQTDIVNLETALDAFEVDCGRYPTEQEGLDALVNAPSDVTGWRGPYLKNATPKDAWGQAYIYRQPGRNNTSGFDLFSTGPNKLEGDEDDLVNWTTD